MGSKNSKIPKPKLPDDNSASSFPYARSSKDARARSQQVKINYQVHIDFLKQKFPAIIVLWIIQFGLFSFRYLEI